MPNDIKELIDDYMKEFKVRLDIYESCLLENQDNIEQVRKDVQEVKMLVNELWEHLDNGYKQELINKLIENINSMSAQDAILIKELSDNITNKQTNKTIQWYKYVAGAALVQLLANMDKIFNFIISLFK